MEFREHRQGSDRFAQFFISTVQDGGQTRQCIQRVTQRGQVPRPGGSQCDPREDALHIADSAQLIAK